MTKPTNLDITNKTVFEQSVYAEFPTSLHEHVEHDLFLVVLDRNKAAVEVAFPLGNCAAPLTLCGIGIEFLAAKALEGGDQVC